MNNDIHFNSQKYVSIQKNTSNNTKETQSLQQQTQNSQAGISDAVNFLGTMGYAQVNMNNPMSKIKTYVADFQNDIAYSEAYTDLCDFYIAKGLTTLEAIERSEQVLNILKQQNTYN